MAGKLDAALTLYDAVDNALVLSGITRQTADKYAHFAVEIYDYIKARPQLQTALKGAKSTYDGVTKMQSYLLLTRLSTDGRIMNTVKYAEEFETRSKVSAGGAIRAFVEYFSGMAKGWGIELNECAIAVTNVILDELTVVAMADTGVGICLAVSLQFLTVSADSAVMARACFG